MSQQQPIPPQTQSPPQPQQFQPQQTQMQPPFTQPQVQLQRPSLTPSVSASSQGSRSGDPQRIKEANARLLRRHREVVSRTNDFLGFMGVMNSAQGNLRKWLDNTKAYYAEARPLILMVLRCALKTLKTLWGLEETDFFHVSMGIDFDPRVGAFKEVMQVVQKYTAYFARENNEEWTVRYLLESINPEIRFAPLPPVALRGLPPSQLAIVASSRSAEALHPTPAHPAISASTSSAAANSPTAASFHPAAAAYSGSAPNSTVGPSEVIAPHLYLAAQDSISAHGQPKISPPVPPQVPMANPAPMANSATIASPAAIVNPAPVSAPMPVAPPQAPMQAQIPTGIQPIAPHMSTLQPATPTKPPVAASPQNAGAAPIAASPSAVAPPPVVAPPAPVAPATQATQPSVVASSTSATMPAPPIQASPPPAQPSPATQPVSAPSASSAQPAPSTQPVLPTSAATPSDTPSASAASAPPATAPSAPFAPPSSTTVMPTVPSATANAPSASGNTPSTSTPPPKPRRPRKMDAEARKRMLQAEAARREQKTAQNQSQSPQLGAAQVGGAKEGEAGGLKTEGTQSAKLELTQSPQLGTLQSPQMAKAQGPQVEAAKTPKVESAQSPLARTVQELPNRATQSSVPGATQSLQSAQTASPQSARTASPQASPSRQTTPAQAARPSTSTSPTTFRPSTLRQSTAPLEGSTVASEPEAVPHDVAPTQDVSMEPVAQEDVEMTDRNEMKLENPQATRASETGALPKDAIELESTEPAAKSDDVQMNAPLEEAMDVDQTDDEPAPQPTIAVEEAPAEQPQVEKETAIEPATESLLPPAAYGLHSPVAEGPQPPAAYAPRPPADVSMAAPEDPGAALSRATSSSFASPAPKSPPQRALTPVPPPDDIGLRICGFTFAGESTVEKCTLYWQVRPTQVPSVKAWNTRTQCTTDFSRAYRDASCITLACYAASDLPASIKDNRYHITSKRPSWPTHTKVRLTVQDGNKERVLSLSPPFKVSRFVLVVSIRSHHPQQPTYYAHSQLTPDGLFDLTPFSAEGANQVTLYLYRAPGDNTDYCFHLYGHRPTPAMVEQVVQAQRRKEEWNGVLASLAKPFDFTLPGVGVGA
ncbi:uncharacterized protein SCHCODRAFT_01168230 [Schizophyllum commune H4-8]|nr:uncharacterized protein SCHCODRAFT_01168230 [Schizophyllum commune H4-8]KAI5900124.1 hypothetical protein SCHCODRAFT_01168230 [Schizophyllum commune H4-8]